MEPGRCSVLITARNEAYLNKTVEDVFDKARGDLEVIVVLDGYKPESLPKERKGLKFIFHEQPTGYRCSINEAAKVASGQYLFKLDAHCLVSEGFDEVLKTDHEEDWVVTLSRYSLDPEKWTLGFGPVQYEYMMYPLGNKHGKIGGLPPKKWIGESGRGTNMGKSNFYWLEDRRRHLQVDEIQAANSACWFVTKNRFELNDCLSECLWNIHCENVEMVLKAWLSGGKFMINKKAFHGHWFKSEKKRTVSLNWEAMRNTQAYFTWYWTHNQWPKQTRTFKWFVEYFWPIPGWPENWEEELAKITEPTLIVPAP